MKRRSGSKKLGWLISFLFSVSAVMIVSFILLSSIPSGICEEPPAPSNSSEVIPVHRESKGIEKEQESTEKKAASQTMIQNVPVICQGDEMPTGCELVSTEMVLQYYGIDITAEELLDVIPWEGLYKDGLGTLYGPTPEKVFVGDPHTRYGFGCFPPVIASTLKKLSLPSGLSVKDTSGTSLAQLAKENIPKGRPVLVWATIEMMESEPGDSWNLPNGERYTWRRKEHCLVLVGCDDQFYYFNDPYQYNGKRSWDKKLVEERYREMGRRSLVITVS